MERDWLRVPIGPHAARWRTRRPDRTVLAVVHNVTSLTRLLDVVDVFSSDPRIQVVFTWTGSSPFTHDVAGFLADIGAMTIPWDQALAEEFDLAVTASYGGDLHRINAPILSVSHGIGYNKRLSKKEDATETSTVFGLSSDWLLNDGRPIPSSIVLSHPEQLIRLERDCPEAVDAAVVAGDPCFDRILASLPHRARYRAALGIPPSHRLVLVSSTWNERSLFGSHPDLIARLLAELPMDEYTVAAALHPNIWHGHGPWQVRAWLADARRAGLVLLPPRDGWRAALAASDVVVGDHGSVTFYAAALDLPVLLGAFPQSDLDPASPVAALGRAAPALDTGRPMRPQIEDAINSHVLGRYSAVTMSTTAVPGRSAALLRTEMYRLMNLPEPTRPPVVRRVPEVPRSEVATPVTAALTAVAWQERTAVLDRLPAAVAPDAPDTTAGRHLAVDLRETDERMLKLAAVLYAGPNAPDRPSDVFAAFPGCFIIALQDGADGCAIHIRDAPPVRCRVDARTIGAAASAVYTWLVDGRTLAELPADATLSIGAERRVVAFTPAL
ncbi:hypothetical protein [Actinomadura atramentaria]|uniref:hypothetical protein n=1 Tax=Actinomadura atramentaria TaxID=1990 RepID=UPI00036E9DBD|nr:hypothetical protein [Actinomadura atramentaria]